MKTIAILSSQIAMMFLLIPLSAAVSGEPEGLWLARDGKAKVKVVKCGGSICGNIVWLRQPNDNKGQPLRDGRNKNPQLRTRPIVGLPILIGMRQISQNKWSGELYDPERGASFSGHLTVLGPRQIKVTGCKFTYLCKSYIWHRLR